MHVYHCSRSSKYGADAIINLAASEILEPLNETRL